MHSQKVINDVNRMMNAGATGMPEKVGYDGGIHSLQNLTEPEEDNSLQAAVLLNDSKSR